MFSCPEGVFAAFSVPISFSFGRHPPSDGFSQFCFCVNPVYAAFCTCHTRHRVYTCIGSLLEITFYNYNTFPIAARCGQCAPAPSVSWRDYGIAFGADIYHRYMYVWTRFRQHGFWRTNSLSIPLPARSCHLGSRIDIGNYRHIRGLCGNRPDLL